MTALYQIFKRLILPPTSLILLLVVGFTFTFVKFRRLGRILLAVGIFFLYLLSISPTADLLLTPLESKYAPLNPERLPRTGTLVVLSGGASATDYLPASSRLTQSATQRLFEAVRLYHLMDRPKIVISGGSGNPFVQVTESALMRELLLDLGIPGKRIVIERKSRNTFENGKAIQQLRLTPPIVLITSASHMERAVKVFKTLGIHSLPAPCDFRAHWSANDPLRFLPSGGALNTSTAAIYEYLGTWWYYLTGKF
jgi:uncharacterized SAM-binding protein YcdF (DUF218 family)